MKYLITNKLLSSDFFSKDSISKVNKNSFTIYHQSISPTKFDNNLAFTNGYLFDITDKNESYEAKEISALKEIILQWPLSKKITGSFSTLIINKKSIIICNDCIGIYPLYYHIDKNDFVISSNLYWIANAIENLNFDDIGVTQKLIGIENANIGSRTILKNVKRLLPGERILFNVDTLETPIKDYDNSLFEIDKDFDTKNKSLNKYWNSYKNEISTLTKNNPQNFLALSGGMDSRILLGAIDKEDNLKCVTYGENVNYEVRIAKRLAKKKNKSFQSFFDYELYFPKKETLEKHIKEHESLRITSWLEILENITTQDFPNLFFGDMCEALPGRNIQRYSSRKKRINSFLQEFFLNKKPTFTKLKGKDFDNWKASEVLKIKKIYSENRIKKLNLKTDSSEIINGIINDHHDIYNRIKNHNLPYNELISELYSWYTHSRIPMGKQILTCNMKFKGLCPPMSLNILRMTSSIHPKFRLGYRFFNKLTRKIPELRSLNSIPTNQSPYINRNINDSFIFLAWGVRSKIDQFLIKRLMKHKNPKMRYRLFKSINWVEIYQLKDNIDKFKSYFKNEDFFINEKERAINKLEKRKNLENWPLSNADLMGIASLSIEMDLIKKLIDKNRKNIN